jgi:hypothetical protein
MTRLFTMMVLSALTVATSMPASAPAQNTAPPGPSIGATLPATAITDHRGRTTHLAKILGRRGAVVTILRSADW